MHLAVLLVVMIFQKRAKRHLPTPHREFRRSPNIHRRVWQRKGRVIEGKTGKIFIQTRVFKNIRSGYFEYRNQPWFRIFHINNQRADIALGLFSFMWSPNSFSTVCLSSKDCLIIHNWNMHIKAVLSAFHSQMQPNEAMLQRSYCL